MATQKNTAASDLVSISEGFGPLPSPTRAQRQLIAAAERIGFDPPDPRDTAFLARQLVQCTLPHTDPGDIPQWTRRSRHVTMGIQPGRNLQDNVSYGYPYGSLPRLILTWVNTEAVKTQSRRLTLGHSYGRFMRELGLDPTHGGRRSDAARLRDQMLRFFSARIDFHETRIDPISGEDGFAWTNMRVTQSGVLWWSEQTPRQDTLWESWIELDELFYRAIIAAPVPLDMRALKALKRSPLALDLCAWATYTVHCVNRQRTPRFVPWAQLAMQVGCDYGRLRHFAAKALLALRKVQVVYPGFHFTPVNRGLLVLPGRTAIVAVK